MTTREVPVDASLAGPSAGSNGGQRQSARSAFRDWASLRQAQIGVGLVLALVAFSFLGPLFYHTNQVTVNLNNATLPPEAGHPLGTDGDGFDILGRLMRGGRSSLELGFAVAITTTVVGTLYGAIAGWLGGIVDIVLMRVVDTLLAVPTLMLLLILVNIFTPNLLMIILLLSALSWLGTARLVRGEVLALRVRDYVQAAKTVGGGQWWIIRRHLVPNAFGVIVVSATFTVADAILTMSALSFLGLGLPPPASDWGSMLTNGLDYLFDGYWWMIYPAAIILVVTVIAFNLIGESIRDSLDVRLR
ncbi:MAG: ABC transporter permease [Trebonia sp.]|jgi:peptide/nickel transport system permease protein